jgi:hypothetical protein
VNPVTGAGLYNSTMVVGIGVNEHRLGVGFADHLFEVSEHRGSVEAISVGGSRTELCIGFHDGDNLDLRAVLVVIEESMHMAVNETDDRDAEWRMGLGYFGKCNRAERQGAE